MNENELFEIEAAVFYKQTGMMAPGKDDWSLLHDRQSRLEAWADFQTVYGKVVRHTIDAMNGDGAMKWPEARVSTKRATPLCETHRCELILNGCPQCGAPQCCPECCKETTAEYEGYTERMKREQAEHEAETKEWLQP